MSHIIDDEDEKKKERKKSRASQLNVDLNFPFPVIPSHESCDAFLIGFHRLARLLSGGCWMKTATIPRFDSAIL